MRYPSGAQESLQKKKTVEHVYNKPLVALQQLPTISRTSPSKKKPKPKNQKKQSNTTTPDAKKICKILSNSSLLEMKNSKKYNYKIIK